MKKTLCILFIIFGLTCAIQSRRSSSQQVIIPQEDIFLQQDQSVQAENSPQQSATQTPAEENLLLKVPFSKEQFEAEMAKQSELLKNTTSVYYQEKLQTLKNILEQNKKIIDEKKQIIKLYMNHTTSYLSDLANVLQRELEQNHDMMLNLAQAVILSCKNRQENKIIAYKAQIEQILTRVQPPYSTCRSLINCESCNTQLDCIWSTDRRACFVGSKYDGCYFDTCMFFVKDNCVSNAKFDREEQDQMKSALTGPGINDEDYNLQEMRIPQTQKDYFIEQQNMLIDMKENIQRSRMFLNYLKKVYYRLRYQNIIFKRKRKQQLKEDKQFLQELDKQEDDFLKKIKESEEEQMVTIDHLIENQKILDKAMEQNNTQGNATNNNQPASTESIKQNLQVLSDGTIILPNGKPLQGLKVFENGQIIDENDNQIRTDLRFQNGRIVTKDGVPLSFEQVQAQLESEESIIDSLLSSWYGSDEEETKEKKLSFEDSHVLSNEKDETVIDIDSSEIEDEEQSILDYVADQVKAQQQEEKAEAATQNSFL